MQLQSAPRTGYPISTPLSLPWLEKSLNGGFRAGSSYLLAGEPGSNKTTLAVQVAADLALQHEEVLYVLTEQSPTDLLDVFSRAICCDVDGLPGAIQQYVHCESLHAIEDLPDLLTSRYLKSFRNLKLIIVDSLQGTGLASTSLRTFSRFFGILDRTRRMGLATLVISHVTKAGRLAGPKSLEHKIDVALQLRKVFGLRQLFVSKNRFGAEVVEPVMLRVNRGRLEPSPHAAEHCSAALGYGGKGDELLEIQASVSLPRLSGRGELNCPYLPAKRVRQIISTLNRLPGMALADLSYSINAFVPGVTGYNPAVDLPLSVSLLAAYFQLPVPRDAVFIGQLDLRRGVRPPDLPYLSALAQMLTCGVFGRVRRVFISGAAAGMLEDLIPDEEWHERIVAVRTLDEVIDHIWPDIQLPIQLPPEDIVTTDQEDL